MATNPAIGNQPQQQIAITQDDAFAESSLPRTMSLARDVKAIIFHWLGDTPANWPFEDKVMGWLVPTMIPDIQSYHSAQGPALAKMFMANAIDHLDNDLHEILATAVEKSNPGLVEQLQQFSAASRKRNE